MKLFKIKLDNVDYDTYDSCIIVAENKEQVEELCRKNFYDDIGGYPVTLVNFDSNSTFNIDEGQNWTIEEIDINKIELPTIISSSFNAG